MFFHDANYAQTFRLQRLLRLASRNIDKLKSVQRIVESMKMCVFVATCSPAFILTFWPNTRQQRGWACFSRFAIVLSIWYQFLKCAKERSRHYLDFCNTNFPRYVLLLVHCAEANTSFTPAHISCRSTFPRFVQTPPRHYIWISKRRKLNTMMKRTWSCWTQSGTCFREE